jgi:hypothetical protein
LDFNTPVFDTFKALPTPDTIKLLDHMNTLDATHNNTIVGCFNTKGEYKTSCPVLQPTHWSDFGLDGVYVRTDYPNWIFLQGMSFTIANQAIAARPDLQFNIPLLLTACEQTAGCVMVSHLGIMSNTLTGTRLSALHSNTFPQLSGVWLKRTGSQNFGLGLEPQPKSF